MLQTRTLAFVSIAFVIFSIALSTPTHADEFKDVRAPIDSMAKLKAEASSHFDGTIMLPRANPSKMSSLARDMAFKLKYAINNYNSLSKELRASPPGQEIAKSLRAYQAYIKALDLAATTGKNSAADAKTQCWNFQKVFRQRKGFSMDTPIKVLLDPENGRYLGQNYTPEFLKQQESMLAEVDEVCNRTEFKAVIPLCDADKSEAQWKMFAVAKKFPGLWCKAAADRKKILKTAIDNFVSTDDSRRAQVSGVNPDTLEQKEGWIAEDRAIEWQSYLFVTSEEQSESLGKYAALYSAIGVTTVADNNSLDERKAAKEKLRLKVQELAPRWHSPPAGPTFYGVNIAKKAMKRWFKGAKVIKAFGAKPGGWTIHKNAIGVPEHRDAWGYVLLRVKGAPFCQLRKFVLSEDYANGGRYQKAKHVTFSAIRWQTCK